jgi:ribosomal-protein-alanine N-acetyltransferase
MIETESLTLIPCELAHFEAILHDTARLERMLDISIADGWIEFPEAMSYGYEYLKTHADARAWWTYLFIHRADRTLIGTGGFKGPANNAGMVEIGYSISPRYRNRGLATEAARGLVGYAFSHPHIKVVEAQTLAQVNPSTSVLEKIGMKKIGTIQDPEDGELWHWRLHRAD